jgi:dienelactone hydrolase
VGSSEVSFEVDGLRCAATVYRPDRVHAPVGCVVMGHGLSLTREDGIPGYAGRFAAARIAALAFDYRHWGGSEGDPRRRFSLRRQLEDWRAAVAFARGLDGVDPTRIAVWGMSLGGGHALTVAASDPGIAAVVALVPMTDGLAATLKPAPPRVTMRIIGRAMRETITRRPARVPVAGVEGSFAVLAASEALPGFERLAGENGWHNEVTSAGLFALGGYRPARQAAHIEAPVLLQLGERDAMVPLRAIENTRRRAPHAQLLRYPIDHFGCFWPEQFDTVCSDEVEFLRRHVRAAAA